jgi:hypothetical protein
MARSKIVWSLLALFAAGMGLLLLRNVRHAVSLAGSGDLTTVFAASRAWLHGGDPYDQQQLLREWYAAGGSKAVEPDPDHTPSVYPPSTFVLVAPVAQFSWPSARLIWVVLDVAVLAAMIVVLPSLAGVSWTDPRAVALAGGVIALGPLRNGVMGGQPAILACGLVVVGVWLAQRHWRWTPGILLGLSCAIKPTIAAPFILYYALRRRWYIAFAATLLPLLILGAGALRLQAADVKWSPELSENLRAAADPGAINDPTAWSRKRFEMINLHVLLHTVFDARQVVSVMVIVLGTGSMLLLVQLIVRHPQPDRRRELAEVAFVASWALLPLYHRWYDAGLLVLVLAWGIAALSVTRWRAWAAASVVLVIAPFIISPALWLARKLPHTPGPPYRYWPGFEQLILPVQVWALVVLCAMLLYVLRQPDSGQRQLARAIAGSAVAE